MVLLTTTPFMHATLSTLPQSLQLALPSLFPTPEIGSPIAHQSLVDLARLLKSHSKPHTLSALLRGTSVYTPAPPPPPAPTPEYLALKRSLLEQRERREYAALLNKQSTIPTDAEDEADKGRDDITPSLVFNVLLSILLCACAAFYMTRWWASDGIRVLLSLFVGFLVGVAETGVYAGYLRKVEQSRKKERRKREVKTVLGEYVGEEGAGEAVGVGLVVKGDKGREKEEIWGRGVNGGMRRRVREKWEKEQLS